MSTNVRPSQLNYDHYNMNKYDLDIVNSVPGHTELHNKIRAIVRKLYGDRMIKIIELGPGTGITGKVVLDILPGSDYTAIDFSKTMMAGVKKRLKGYSSNFIFGDFSKMEACLSLEIL